MAAQGLIAGLIMLVVFVLILTALAPTVITNTNTAANKPLENASSAGKSMYSLIEILFAVVGVMAVIGFGLGRKY